jgi:hypothetical protein
VDRGIQEYGTTPDLTAVLTWAVQQHRRLALRRHNMAREPQRQKANKTRSRNPLRPKVLETMPSFIATDRDIDKYFSSKSLWRIDQLLKAGRYVSPEEVADAIEANPGERLPSAVRALVCLVLRARFKKKRGPKPQPLYNKVIFHLAVRLAYEEELHKFQKQHKTDGRQRGGWAPHERAIAAIKTRFKPLAKLTTGRIANILSSRRNTPKFP